MLPNDQQPSNFQPTQNLFPSDRPDVMPTPQEPIKTIGPEVMKHFSVRSAVDMEIVDMVNSRLELSKNWRRNYRLVWDKAWQNMKGVYDRTGKAAWQSTTFMPLTSKVVEVITANIHSAVFSPEMPVEWQSRRSDMEGDIRSINEVTQSDFDKCQAKAQFTDFLRNMNVMGTAIGEVGYIKKEETVMIKERQLQLPPQVNQMLKEMGVDSNEQFVPKKMLVKDHATITNVDLYDIYPQPRVMEFSKDMWVVHKTTITNRELKIGSMDPDEYYRLDNVTDDLLEGQGMARVDQDPEKQTRRFTLLDYNFYTHHLDPDRPHELSKFYGQIPLWYLQPEIRNDKSRQYDSVPGCIWVVDGQWVVWKRMSPWRDGEPPYFKGNYIRVPGEFYGIGVAELVMGLQTEKNEIRNSRMDNINLAMNKIIAVIKEAVPNGEWKRLVSEPGAIWAFKGVDDVRKVIQQIEFGNQISDTWQASEEVEREASEVTAANKETQAAGGDGGADTFRGQMQNIQQATGRWMLYARLFEWVGLVPAMKKFYQRIYQFKSYEDISTILGPERGKMFQFISPEELDMIAKLVPLGTMTMENKGVKLAQMTQFATMWKDQVWFKALEFARKMAITAGDPEPDQYLFSDQEMQQYNQMKMQAAMFDPMSEGQPGMPPSATGQPIQGVLGPNGQPARTPQSGQAGNVPGGMNVSGNVPGPSHGMPRPAQQARGPGASPFDSHGTPLR